MFVIFVSKRGGIVATSKRVDFQGRLKIRFSEKPRDRQRILVGYLCFFYDLIILNQNDIHSSRLADEYQAYVLHLARSHNFTDQLSTTMSLIDSDECCMRLAQLSIRTGFRTATA